MEQQITTAAIETNGTGINGSQTEQEKFKKFASKFGAYSKELKLFEPVHLTIEHVSMLYIKEVKDQSFNYAERIIMKAEKMMNDLHLEVMHDDARVAKGEPRVLTIEMIENNLKEIEKLYNSLEGTGGFMVKYRGFIKDKLIKPSSSLTDKIDPNEWKSFIAVKDILKDLKTKDKANQDLLRNKELEKNQLIAHIENYNSQAKQEFKDAVLREVATMKQSYLKGLVENPEIEPIKEAVKDIKIKEYVSDFDVQFLSIEELDNVHAAHQLPPIEKFWEAANSIIDHAFADYKEQLAIVKAQPENKRDEKVQESTKDLETLRNKIQEESKTEQAVNTLKSTAVTVPEVRPVYKPLKGYYTIKIDEATFENKLLSVWLSNPILKTFASSIKSVINRTDKQRVDAICAYAKETGNKFPEFEYEYSEK